MCQPPPRWRFLAATTGQERGLRKAKAKETGEKLNANDQRPTRTPRIAWNAGCLLSATVRLDGPSSLIRLQDMSQNIVGSINWLMKRVPFTLKVMSNFGVLPIGRYSRVAKDKRTHVKSL